MINEALKYVQKGYWIIPVHTIIKGKCGCGNDKCPEKSWGKHPRTINGIKDASNSEKKIKEWWGKWPDSNIGIVCDKSGIAVLDVDPRNGGDLTLSNIVRGFGEIPETVEALSGGGGPHYYFSCHKDFNLPEGFHGKGLDIRKTALIIAPPSLHKSGNRYEWVAGQSLFDIDPVAPPDFLINAKKTDVEKNVCDGTAMDDLKKLSGKDEIRNEEYTFHKNTNGTYQIHVNGKSTGAWIDTQGYIGSHSRGGPTIIQWIEWFGHSRGEAEEIAKKYIGDLTKKEITLKIASEYCAKYDDTIWIQQLDCFHIYNVGRYERKEEKEMELILLNRIPFVQRMTNANRKKIIENMKMFLLKKLEDTNPRGKICLKNGVYDLGKFEFNKHSKKEIFTIQLPYDYEENSDCPVWLKTIDSIFYGDKNKIRTIKEYMGYCLTRSVEMEKALFMIGTGSTGKSTVSSVIQNLVGEENFSALPLKHFNNPILTASLINKLVNISGEMSKKAADFVSDFNGIVSGEPILINEKYIPSYKISPFCKLVFSANELPYIDDKSSGFWRRLLVVNFEREFSEEEQNKDLKKIELPREMPGIFNWAIDGLKALTERKHFIIDEYMRRLINDIRKDNNPIQEWCEESIIPVKSDENIIGIHKGKVYSHYKDWCKENGYTPYGHNKFSSIFYNLNKNVTDKDERSEDGTRFWPGLILKNNNGIEKGEVYKPAPKYEKTGEEPKGWEE